MLGIQCISNWIFSGGGYYNNKGNKVGKWRDVELRNNYNEYECIYNLVIPIFSILENIKMAKE